MFYTFHALQFNCYTGTVNKGKKYLSYITRCTFYTLSKNLVCGIILYIKINLAFFVHFVPFDMIKVADQNYSFEITLKVLCYFKMCS